GQAQGTADKHQSGVCGWARKRLRASGALLERRSGLAYGGAGRGLVSCPPFVQDAAQPQEDYQKKVMEKDVVYHSVSLLFWENDDRLPDSQAGDLSARERDTTQPHGFAGCMPTCRTSCASAPLQ